MSEVIGSFVFRDDGDGCLSAKYIDKKQKIILAEICKRKPGKESGGTGKFIGTYYTVWFDDPGMSVDAELKIEKDKKDSYKLNWYKGNKDYEGVAMLYNDLLIGAYWQVK